MKSSHIALTFSWNQNIVRFYFQTLSQFSHFWTWFSSTFNVRASCEVTNVGHLDFVSNVLDPQDCSVPDPVLLKLSFDNYILKIGTFWTPCVSILYTGPRWQRYLAGCDGRILCHGYSLPLWPYCLFPDTPVGRHSLSVEVTMEMYFKKWTVISNEWLFSSTKLANVWNTQYQKVLLRLDHTGKNDDFASNGQFSDFFFSYMHSIQKEIDHY